MLAVAAGAGLTVMLATLLGLPISTTHGLTGALAGGGIAAVGNQVNFSVLGNVFFLPLVLSPLISLSMSAVLYLLFRFCRIQLGVGKETCLCVGEAESMVITPQPAGALAYVNTMSPKVHLRTQKTCQQIYTGTVIGINARKALDVNHFISAGVVSFARGLNDTPKIVAMLLALQAVDIKFSVLAIALVMAAGGLINAKKVALTMSKKITPLNHGQGFTANLVTGLMVVFASRLGVPVSTTHVSVGSIFGIGLITREANTRVISGILLSWFFTLPLAAIFSCLVYWLVY
jgi:PiT family inorganic phosphate transporter